MSKTCILEPLQTRNRSTFDGNYMSLELNTLKVVTYFIQYKLPKVSYQNQVKSDLN